jgi:hypothetical protein
VPKRTPTGQASRAHGRRTKAYYEDLVRFTDERGITKRDGSGRPAYAGVRPGSRNYYPDWLVRMYDEHLEKEQASQPAA